MDYYSSFLRWVRAAASVVVVVALTACEDSLNSPDDDLLSPQFWGSSSCNFSPTQCNEIAGAIDQLQNHQLDYCRSIGSAAWERFISSDVGFYPGDNQPGELGYTLGEEQNGVWVNNGNTYINDAGWNSAGYGVDWVVAHEEIHHGGLVGGTGTAEEDWANGQTANCVSLKM